MEKNIIVQEIHRSVASHMSLNWGSGLQPRHVLCLGIEPAPFNFPVGTQFTEPHQLEHIARFYKEYCVGL